MNKQWFHAGPHAAQGPKEVSRGPSQPSRNLKTNKDILDLRRAESDLREAERRIERQIVLIGELSERGEAILEPERALARLQTKMHESRDWRAQLLNKLPLASNGATGRKETSQPSAARAAGETRE